MHNGTGPEHTAVGGALVVGSLAGLSGGGGLALLAGLDGLPALVTFLGSAVGFASLAVLLTILEGLRTQASAPDDRDDRPRS